jgi:MFS family permease
MPRTVRSLIAIRVINELGAFTLSFLAVVAGTKSAAVVLTAFALCTIPSRMLGGWLTARMRPGVVVAAGLFASACAMILLVPAKSLPALVIVAGLLGLAFEIYEPASQELIAAESSEQARTRFYNVLGISMSLTGVAAGVFAAILLPIGVRWLFVVDSLTCLMAAALALYFLRDSGAARLPAPERPVRQRRIPKLLALLTLANLFFALAYMAVIIFLPLGLLDQGAPTWLPGVTLATGAVVALLADRYLRPRLPEFPAIRQGMFGCLLLTAIGLGLAASSGILLVGCYLIWSIVDVLMAGLWSGLVADAAPPADRPRWFAIHGSSWGIAQVLVPWPVAGLIALDNPPLRSAGVVAAAGMAAAAAALWIFARSAGLRTPLRSPELPTPVRVD